jgi:tetratricopeptide (TPR) repeat protein
MEGQKVHIKEKIAVLDSEIRKSKELNKGFSKSSLDELILLYDELLKLDNEDYFAYLEKSLAQMYILNDYKGAEQTLESAVQIFGYNKVLYLRLSDTYQELGKFKKSLTSLDEVIQKEFATDYFYAQRAILNRKLGNISEAEKDQKIYDDYEAREKAKWDDPNHYYHYK